MKIKVILLFLLGATLVAGCLAEDVYGNTHDSYLNDNKEADSTKNSNNELPEGIKNAVKKAYQMTDLSFTPLNPIDNNSGVYQPNTNYKGLIYSSVKETETYVGENVSFHTFLSAVNNPRSKLYTERMDHYPYHGVNCKAYYGTVCSGLVSYALGLVPRYASFDFPESDLMDIVNFSSPENLRVADVLWREGHVALITDICSNGNDQVTTIEISEAPSNSCRRYTVSREKFLEVIMGQNFKRVYRYRYIDKNSIPIPEIAVDNCETMSACVDKGDKSCYLEDENVVINILCEGCIDMEIYKDGKKYMVLTSLQDKDVTLANLTYGDYMARVVHHDETTGYIPPKITREPFLSNCETCWKVVNTKVSYDNNNCRLYFNSLNSKPLYAIACKENGSRIHLRSGFYHIFSEDDINRGYIDVNREKIDESYPYIKLFFETDFGTIINTPINCFEK